MVDRILKVGEQRGTPKEIIWERLNQLACYHAGQSIRCRKARGEVSSPFLACEYNKDMNMHIQARLDIMEIIEKYNPE